MKIFLSYAREDRQHAADIVMALRGRGHEVFFDADPRALPPGDSFDRRIQGAIEAAHKFVFLISPDSIAPGGYALTELAIAERVFNHPVGRVLPVLLRPTPVDAVPPFLRAVTFLEPKGNVAAEVGMWLGNATAWRKRLAVVAVVVGVAVGGAAMARSIASKPGMLVEARPVGHWEHGLFGRPDSYLLLHENRNASANQHQIVAATAKVDPPGSVTVVEAGDVNEHNPLSVAPGEIETNQFIVQKLANGPQPRSWTACVTIRGRGEICSKPRPWEPVVATGPRVAFSLPKELAAHLIAVSPGADRFYLLARNPSRIVVISVDGAPLAQRDLDGEPTAIELADGDLFVATRGPNEVVRYAAASLELLARRRVVFPPSIRGTFNDPVSSSPAGLAADREWLYVLTRGGAAATGLILFKRDLGGAGVVPPYFDEVSSSLRDMHLVSSSDGVWGAQSATTPASLYRIEPRRLAEFSGHNFEVASCATDVLPYESSLIIPECSGRLVKVSLLGETLTVDRSIQQESGVTSGPGLWTTQLIRRSGETIAVVTNTARPGGRMMPLSTSVWIAKADGVAGKLSEFAEAQIVDVAVIGNRALFVFEDVDGRRDARAFRLD